MANKEVVKQGIAGSWQWSVEKVAKKEANQFGSHFFLFNVYQVKNIGYGNKEYGKSCPSWEGDDKLEATRQAVEAAKRLEEEHRAEHEANNADTSCEDDSCPYEADAA